MSDYQVGANLSEPQLTPSHHIGHHYGSMSSIRDNYMDPQDRQQEALTAEILL
jgi:hypothetical protein